MHTIDPAIIVETDFSRNIADVEVDLTQMQMVLSAIVANASEALEGEGHIRISTKEVGIDEEFVKHHPGLKPGPYVCLTVEDDGKGMNEETKSRVFEPFFTTKFQGRGLGMAAVYGIVQNHGGWISVDSKLEKGTVIQVNLPALKVQAKNKKKQRTEMGNGTGTILVVEDEEVVTDVISQMLEKLDYRILLAKTGKEAVDIAKTFEGNIDLSLLDIVLPDMVGRDIYPLLMEARPNLKVIVCSGYDLDGPGKEILDAGAQDFIQKPFAFTALSEKVREVLEAK